jgi:hypothetical protein
VEELTITALISQSVTKPKETTNSAQNNLFHSPIRFSPAEPSSGKTINIDENY